MCVHVHVHNIDNGIKILYILPHACAITKMLLTVTIILYLSAAHATALTFTPSYNM